MTALRGLVIAGDVLPGTEWCRRDPRAWWQPGEKGTRRRGTVRDLLCGHWTGGEAGLARTDDDGPTVVANMRARGLTVGIEFVIGACAIGDEFAPVWQTADPGATATVHVGLGDVNARAIGVEVVSCGLYVQSRPERPRPLVVRRVRDRRVECAAFLPGQIRAWLRLADSLTDPGSHVLRAAGIQIPRCVPTTTGGTLLSEVRHFRRAELGRYAGALEHALVPRTAKLDAGGMLLAALRDHGWETRPLGV